MVKKAKDIQESLDFIIEHMATKGDIDGLQKKLDDHTRRLNIIENDVKTGLDRRVQLEVRVGSIEKHLHVKPPAGTLS